MAILSAVLLSKGAANALISGLVQHGLTVTPGSKDGRSIWEGEASVLVVCEVSEGRDVDVKTERVVDAAKKALLGVGTMWHSIVVFSTSYVQYVPSNIKLPEKPVGPRPATTRFDMLDKDV